MSKIIEKNCSNEILQYLTICQECSSLIEILSINDNKNIIEYKCLKSDKKFITSIKEYLEKIKENMKSKINEVKDICDKHKSEKYICYCFDCKNHLCKECLETGDHISHRKNNIIEIKPIKEELNIIEETIKYYKQRLENTKNKKLNIKKINEDLSNKEMKFEEIKLNNKIKKNKENEENELLK